MNRLILKTTLFCILLIHAAAIPAASADAERVAATLEQLRQSINAHDFAAIEPSLDADFTYQGRDARMSRMIMQQVVAGYPRELTAITVLSVSASNDIWDVAVRLESADQAEQRNIRLSQNYRLVQADIADLQLAGHPQPLQKPPSPAPGARLPDVTTIPFELAKNLIVVQAEINGIAGNYLVDTGAQAVMLNKSNFNPDFLNIVPMNHAPPTGVNGTIQNVQGATNLELTLGPIQINGLRGLVMDLSPLEKSIGIPVAGIIGYNVLERFQIYFDYAAAELTLYSLDSNGRLLADDGLGSPEQVTSFELSGYIPVFPVKIAGHEIKMGLDSGAGNGMLFQRWQAPLEGQYEFIERAEMRGADDKVEMGDVGRISSMQLQDISYANMTFHFNDIATHDGSAMPFEGLLGYEFLMRRPTAINFRARQLLVWPRSSTR